MMKKDTVKVIIKIRPNIKGKNIITVSQDNKQVFVRLPSEQAQRIQVEMVHDANKTIQSLYTNCHANRLIGKFIQGYNITVITYGQSGSGKTFALQGDSNNKGIIFEALRDIYANKTSNQAIIKCSFLQLYNEKITDMFNPESEAQRGLKLRWEIQKQFIIQDLIDRQCKGFDEMIKEWNSALRNRVIANNKINDYSSRSHSIFIVTMEDYDEERNYRVRQAYFVDLAGSERVFTPVGRLTKEAIQINKSLFFLRKIILSLEERYNTNKEVYIPYRDSKLTSILKKSFGGNCLTYMIACINPSQDYLEQTLSTLQYAVSAGKIHNEVNINIDIKARQIRQLRQQKQKLKKQLSYALIQIQSFKSIQREEEVKRLSNNQYANKIVQCIGTIRELLKSNKQLRGQLEKEKMEKKQMALELQECQKKIRIGKKQDHLSPIKEYQARNTKKSMNQTKNRFINSEPRTKMNTLSNEIIESVQTMTERPLFSKSIDYLKRKQRNTTTIHRKKYLLHEKQT